MGVSVQFEDRVVAFVDVLGFKSLVNSAVNSSQHLNQLSGLVDLLASAIPHLDKSVDASVPSHLIPQHTYISDCIILSAPIQDSNRPGYNGLEIIVMRVIQLSHYFLSAGYLIRGGITTGKVWHTPSNIVGPAYQEAFELEQRGNEPVVLLSASAVSQWRGGSRMCLAGNDKIFVNGLFDYYIPNSTSHGAIEATYDSYEMLATNRISSTLPESAIAKWQWFLCFLRSEKPEGMKWSQA